MMPRQTPTRVTTFGYLSCVESDEHGLFGGYLIVSTDGRPLEFHCTAPIRPSRAQQILYGPTLQPYLLGEQIAGALLTKAQTKPQIILTDQPSVLCQRNRVEIPLAFLAPTASEAGAAGALQFLVSGHVCELPVGFESDREAAAELLTALAKQVDLAEPFGRIHEAICEAQRMDVGGAEPHGQAA
jgi:hypothetical protein